MTRNDMVNVLENPVGHDVSWDFDKRLAMSFSKLKTFAQCPRQYQAKFITKTAPYHETAATIWGNDVHKAMENFIKEGTPLPSRMKHFQPMADAIIRAEERAYQEGRLETELFAEQKWAIDLTGRACGYFDKDVWLRGQADYGYATKRKLHVNDFKTGKGKYPDTEQIEAMALLAVGRPEFYSHTVVEGKLLFLEANKVERLEVDVGVGPARNELLRKWQAKTFKVLEAYQNDSWQENPTPLCGWCPVTECPHNTVAERERRELKKR